MRIDDPKLFQGSNFENLTVDTGTAFPAQEDVGELFFRTDLNKLFVYDGTSWIDTTDTGSGLGTANHIDSNTLATLTTDTSLVPLAIGNDQVTSGRQIIFDRQSVQSRVWNGAAWVVEELEINLDGGNVAIGDTLSAGGDISTTGLVGTQSVFDITNNINSGTTRIRTRTGAGTELTSAVFDDDQQEFYADGDLHFTVDEFGINTIDQAVTGTPYVRWIKGGTEAARIQSFSDTNFYIDNRTVGGDLLFRVSDAAAADQTVMRGNAGGSVEFYHDNVKVIETTNQGFQSIAATGVAGVLQISADAGQVTAVNLEEGPFTKAQFSYIPNDNRFQVRVSDTGDNILFTNLVDGDMLQATGGGSVDLYHNGVLKAATTAAGFDVTGTAMNLDGSAEAANTGLFINAPTGQDGFINFRENGTDTFRIFYDTSAAAAKIRTTTGTGAGIIVLEDGNSTSTMAQFDGAGAVDLYHNDALAFRTESNGVGVRASGTGTNATITLTDGDSETAVLFKDNGGTFEMRNQEHGAPLGLSAEDAGGVVRQLLFGDPDNAVFLYYNGTYTAATQQDGLHLKGDGTDTVLSLRNTGGTQTGFLRQFDNSGTGNIELTNQVDGGQTRLFGSDSGSVSREMLTADPDFGVNLYYQGNLRALTDSDGMTLRGDGANTTLQLNDGSTGLSVLTHDITTGLILRNLEDGTNLRLQGEDAGGTLRTFLTGDPDGASTLNNSVQGWNIEHNGATRLSTVATGVDFFGSQIDLDNSSSASATSAFIRNSEGGVRLLTDAGQFLIRQVNSGGTGDENWIVTMPDAGVGLYYDNVLKLSTDDFGATVEGTGALRVPNGTTAQQPTAELGMIRYNTTSGEFEGYDGAWGPLAAGGGGGASDLDDLTDVTITSAASGDMFYRGASVWENTSVFTMNPAASGNRDITLRGAAGNSNLTSLTFDPAAGTNTYYVRSQEPLFFGDASFAIGSSAAASASIGIGSTGAMNLNNVSSVAAISGSSLRFEANGGSDDFVFRNGTSDVDLFFNGADWSFANRTLGSKLTISTRISGGAVEELIQINPVDARIDFTAGNDNSARVVDRANGCLQTSKITPGIFNEVIDRTDLQGAVQTSNQTAFNTTLIDANDLSGFPLQPSSSYLVEVVARFSGNGATANGFRWGFQFESGQISNVTTFNGSAYSYQTGGTSEQLVTPNIPTLQTKTSFDAAGVDETVEIKLGLVTNSSYTASARIDFQFAQGTLNGTGTILEAGSYMRVTKIA